jgi:hypothetical protein
MDKCRQMDKAQNQNARFIDTFGHNNKTSVKTMQPPGGTSSFSLGWSEPVVQKRPQKKQVYTGYEKEDLVYEKKEDLSQKKDNYGNDYEQKEGNYNEKDSNVSNAGKPNVKV